MSSVLEKPVKIGGSGVRGRKSGNRLLLAAGVSTAIVAVILILYFTVPKFRNVIRDLINIRGGAQSTAPSVTFTLTPEEVKPNTAFNIQGQFQDANGKAVKVKQGYYYVFQIDTQGNKQALVTQGSLGQNISIFNVLVPTTNWTDQAKFAVDVSDTAYSAAQLSAMIKPTGATALGQAGGFNPTVGNNVLVQSVSQV